MTGAGARTKQIDLRPLSRTEAARVAAAKPAPEDRWIEGFPREDDTGPAFLLAGATSDPAPFGVYALIPREHGRIIGTAGFFGPPDDSGAAAVTIGYGMVEPEWGQGYGTQAVAALIEVCRAHGGVRVVNADTDLDNIGSQRVLEKNGFIRVRTTESLHYYALQLVS